MIKDGATANRNRSPPSYLNTQIILSMHTISDLRLKMERARDLNGFSPLRAALFSPLESDMARPFFARYTGPPDNSETAAPGRNWIPGRCATPPMHIEFSAYGDAGSRVIAPLMDCPGDSRRRQPPFYGISHPRHHEYAMLVALCAPAPS